MSLSSKYLFLKEIEKSKQLAKDAWIIIFYLDFTVNFKDDYFELFLENSINTLIKELHVTEINIYVPHQSMRSFNKLKTCPIITFSKISLSPILVIKNSLQAKHNIIFLQNGYGYLRNKNSILTRLITTHILAPRIDNTIDPRLLILPNNILTKNTIEDVLCVGSWELVNKKGNLIKDLSEFDFSSNFIVYGENLRCIISEFVNLTNKKLMNYISYDQKDFYYYPCLDSNHIKQYILETDSEIKQKFNQMNIINTNGFAIAIDNHIKIWTNLYRRYMDKTSGIFIRKRVSKYLIPKILHHIWFMSQPNSKYKEVWPRYLRSPWQYRIWDLEQIQQLLQKSRWGIFQTDNLELKSIIVRAAILEEFGGLTVDSHVIPINPIPDEILDSMFIISFFDEQYSGTKLSYRVIGSIKETDLFDEIYRILIDNFQNGLKIIHTKVLFDDRITIYPSYYFNPNGYLLPISLLTRTICISLWEQFLEKPKVKCKENINYTVDLMTKLNENPKDRIQ